MQPNDSLEQEKKSQEHELDFGDIFKEPEDYYPEKPEAQIVKYQLELAIDGFSKQEISLRLVGTHPLWGHYLWNAAKVLVKYMEQNPGLIKDKNVLELGAASGLPSLVSAMLGAKKVVMTDYPDAELIENMKFNAKENFPRQLENGTISVDGFIWGKDIAPLQQHLPSGQNYNLLILSDLIFNHSEHRSLLKSCKELLSENTISSESKSPKTALVFFSHHRPKLADKDNSFFEVAQIEFGFKVEKVLETYTGPMFEVDEGDEVVRGTVHGYIMTL